MTEPSPTAAAHTRSAPPAHLGNPSRIAEIMQGLLPNARTSMEQLVELFRFRDDVRAAFSGKGSAASFRSEAEEVRRELELLGWLETAQEGWALTKEGRAVAEQTGAASPARFALILCQTHETRNNRVVSRLLARLWKLSREGIVTERLPPTDDFPTKREALHVWLQQRLPAWFKELQQVMSGFVPPVDALERFEASLDYAVTVPDVRTRRRRVREVFMDKMHEMLFGQICAPRHLHTWQNRLNWAGLTMTAREVPHRLWFAVGAFRSGDNANFTPIAGLCHDERTYCVHTPRGIEAEQQFVDILYRSYQLRQHREGVEYVSLLAVRDHVCHAFKISNSHFEWLLQLCFVNAIEGNIPYSMALEVDISPAERSKFRNSMPILIDHAARYIITMRKLAAPTKG